MLRSSELTAPYRYLFVGGLHRSGTSLTARLAASLDGVATITDAPVPENEGAYLQGAILHDALSGRPMHFATDPDQHLTEAHALNCLETRLRLDRDWAPWFGPGSWRVEKSPVNLTRMRLLQQLFPLSQFLVVIRHPEAVAAAVAKWIQAPTVAKIDHWLDAHDRLTADLCRVHSVAVLRYEDIATRPSIYRIAIATFLDLPPPTVSPEAHISNRNEDYAGAPRMNANQAERAARWGYAPGLETDANWTPKIQHPLRSISLRTSEAFGSPGSIE